MPKETSILLDDIYFHHLNYQSIYIEAAPSVSVNLLSLVASCVGLQEEEEPQTAFILCPLHRHLT